MMFNNNDYLPPKSHENAALFEMSNVAVEQKIIDFDRFVKYKTLIDATILTLQFIAKLIKHPKSERIKSILKVFPKRTRIFNAQCPQKTVGICFEFFNSRNAKNYNSTVLIRLNIIFLKILWV